MQRTSGLSEEQKCSEVQITGEHKSLSIVAQQFQLTVSDRFFLGCGCGGVGVGVGVWVCGVLGGCVGVSCWLAVAAAGGPLLAGVEAGVLGDVGVAGFAALLALYMGVLCLYWPGKVAAAPAPGVASSSGWRAA